MTCDVHHLDDSSSTDQPTPVWISFIRRLAGSRKLLASFRPLRTKHQVDLAINGHNHVYEWTDAIKGGEVGKQDSYVGPVHDHDTILTFHWTKLRLPDPADTVEWSRVRYTASPSSQWKRRPVRRRSAHRPLRGQAFLELRAL